MGRKLCTRVLSRALPRALGSRLASCYDQSAYVGRDGSAEACDYVPVCIVMGWLDDQSERGHQQEAYSA